MNATDPHTAKSSMRDDPYVVGVGKKLKARSNREQLFKIYCSLLSNPNLVVVQPHQIAGNAGAQIVVVPIVMDLALSQLTIFNSMSDEDIANQIAKIEDNLRLSKLQSPRSNVIELK